MVSLPIGLHVMVLFTYIPYIILGECKPIIAGYLRCLRRLKGINDTECRLIAKEYLRCRMEQLVLHPRAHFTVE